MKLNDQESLIETEEEELKKKKEKWRNNFLENLSKKGLELEIVVLI